MVAISPETEAVDPEVASIQAAVSSRLDHLLASIAEARAEWQALSGKMASLLAEGERLGGLVSAELKASEGINSVKACADYWGEIQVNQREFVDISDQACRQIERIVRMSRAAVEVERKTDLEDDEAAKVSAVEG